MDVAINNEHLELNVTNRNIHGPGCESKDDLDIGKVHPDKAKRDNLSKFSKATRNPCVQKYRPVNKSAAVSSITEKLKASRIPRRKSFTKEVSDKENPGTSKIGPNTYQLPTEANNVQRVQLLINPEFVHNNGVRNNSMAISRPIPTLGQIYNPNTTMQRERLNDWFLELNAPANSLESNLRSSHMGPGSASDNSTRGVMNAELTHNFPHAMERPTMVFESQNFCERFYKTTNDNVSEWLSSDLEYPTRDDESGYRSLSPPKQAEVVKSKNSDGTSVVKHSNESYCLALTSDTNSDRTTFSVVNSDKIKLRVTDQPTMIIGKVTTEGFTNNPCKVPFQQSPVQQSTQNIETELSKNYQYPSNTGPRPTEENHNIPVPSYVDCPSEMLQKTTNFEGEGYESPKTLSSIAATDLEIRDELSSQSTLEQMDDCSLSDQTNAEWCHDHSKESTAFFKPSIGSEDTTFAEPWNYHYLNDSRHNHCHVCCKRRHYEVPYQGKTKARYKYEQDKFKRFPSSRYKLKHLASLRRRLSIRRICRRRWHSVWKKTAERWAMWSKSPTKLKKPRLINYLQRSIIWEDANVQTTILAYRETGIDTALKEQKSAGITTSLKFNAWLDKAPSGAPSNNKSRLKHANQGPSMFPFLYNSKRKSLPLQNIRETQPMKRINSYPEDNRNRHSSNKLAFPINGKQQFKTDSLIRNRSLNGNILIEEGRVPETGVKKSFLLSDNLCGVNISNKSIATEQLQVFDDDVTYGVKMSSKSIGSEKCLCDDKVTSTMLHLSSIKLLSPSKDAYTQVMITCNTAETGIVFHPSCHSCACTLSDSTSCYRKSFATNTDSISRPIKSNNFASVMTSNVIMQHAMNSDTQVTPTPSVKQVSAGYSTSLPMVSEKTSTYFKGSLTRVEKKDASTQSLPQGPILTVTGTKIMSISSAEILSATAITSRRDLSYPECLPSQIHFKSGDCLTSPSLIKQRYQSVDRISSDKKSPDRISSGAETKSALFRENKATSVNEIKYFMDTGISAYNCLHKVDFNNGSHETIRSVEVSGTVTDSFVNKCVSTNGLLEYIDAGVSVSSIAKKIPFSHSIQRTSLNQIQSDKSLKSATTSTCLEKLTIESGVQSDKETYNKSVCTDTIVYPKPECVEQVTSAMQAHNDVAVQISNPSQNEAETDPLHTPHIGRSRLMSVCMLSNSVFEATTQTDVCYGTGLERLTQAQFKSASILTSQEMITKPAFGTLTDKDHLEGGQVVLRACTQISSASDTNNNVDCLTVPILECPTQTELSPEMSRDLATVLSNCTHKCLGSRNSNLDQENQQIQSLSQLMANRKSSHAEPSCPPVTSVVLSSNLNAAKWIKKCTSLDKHYQLMIDPGRSTPDASSNASSKCPIDALKKFHSLQSTRPSYRQPDLHYDIPEPLPALSMDSLADVLPISDAYERTIIAPAMNNSNKLMVDRVTSDETLTKDVKECTLQTTPDIRDAATDSGTQETLTKKSASVLTSRCILPTPCNCCPNDSGNYSDCLFVYGKPHCIVHNEKQDACIQKNPSYRDVELDSRHKSLTQSIGLFTSCIGLSPSACLRKPTESQGEVLSPKVYKALYDTTKLISKEECTAKDKVLATKKSSSVDAEIEAAVLRAAGVQAPSAQCYCKAIKSDDEMKLKASVLKTANMFTQTCPYCCAKLLEIPSNEINPIEECMKTHLVASCRYYSNLLTKHLGRVKNNLVRKNMTPSIERCLYEIPDLSYAEACTMKPSGRGELGCQTVHHKTFKPKRASCCPLSPAASITDICKYDKEHLKSVYYILTSIEGRLRRFKTNMA